MKNAAFWNHSSSGEPQKSHVVIGGASQTGTALQEVLSKYASDTLIITTSRNGTKILNGGETQKDIGLDLSQKNASLSIQSWVTGQVDMLTSPEIVLHLHAMSMNGIDTQYPENIVKEIQKYSGAVLKVIYISYEDGYDAEKNPTGSHVSYDARTTKEAIEASVKRLGEQKAIVDLIVFDSPSAKVLGPTFVGVVGDFMSFYKTQIDTREVGAIERYFGKEFDGVAEFLEQYPMRGVLSEGQESMKELASKGKFQEVINTWTKKMNFGSLSLVSGLISQVYLQLAMRYIQENESQILSSEKRVLLTWDEICKNISKKELEMIFENLFIRMRQKFSVGKSTEINQKSTVGIFIKNRRKNYVINTTYLPLINEHFGIVPMMLQHQLVEQSGVLNGDEYISSIKCPSQMYAGEEVKLIREGDEISLVSASNIREVFTQISIGKKSIEIPKRKKGYTLERDTIETEEVIHELIPKIPHRGNWAKLFIQSIPEKIGQLKINTSSSIIEFIGFKIGTLLKTQGHLLHEKFGVKIDDLEKLKGIFGKVDIAYISSDFENIIKTGDFTLEIERFVVRSGIVSVKINIVHQDELKASFSVIGA